MAKVADRYFQTNEWSVREEGFDPAYGTVSESVFSLGNEYMGVRGYFEEDYTGPALIGSYFNGVYERIDHGKGGYKGIANSTEYMVNSVNWLATRIQVDGEYFDLNQSKIKEYWRELDLTSGVLNRHLIWEMSDGKELEMVFERFLSMQQVQIGAQKISLRALNFDGAVHLTLGLDFSVIHQSVKQNMWTEEAKSAGEKTLCIRAVTKTTQKEVSSTCRIAGDGQYERTIQNDCYIGNEYVVAVSKNEMKYITRLVCNQVLVHETEEENNQWNECTLQADKLLCSSYEERKEETKEWWAKVWESSDIVIEGDPLNQQGIRFCIFQMFQTYHGAVEGTNIGAKGLTGEAYNGNTFWDTETYCLPFYLFNHMEAAKNLLIYRYRTLPQAKERAKQLDCEGAFYPIATISGSECCNLWQHASLQLQASTGVAYGIWFYDKMTEDTEFLFRYGLEMLVEISRMLVTRGDYNADGTKFGYYCVMGPDEFQMMVNHNCYTNFMGKFTLEYTCAVWERLQKADPKRLQELETKLNVSEEERARWRKTANDMYLPYDGQSKRFEQHDGYFKLPHVDVDQIPVEDFPLYYHWSYDRIYRNDMIKQPDVLMFLFLFNSSFTFEQLKANYEYYEPRCIHESSLSPSVHSILASQLKKPKEAYEFFQFATRMDLDNYNRNSNEGLHTTSIAAAWMNIVYGFGGMRSDGKELSFHPSIPKNWSSYRFCIGIGQEVIELTITQSTITLRTKYGTPVFVTVYGSRYQISKANTTISIPKEWTNASE